MKKEEDLKRDTILSLYERDYVLLSTHHSKILDTIEADVAAGIPVVTIARWARSVTSERELLQRIENTAAYLTWLQES